MAERRILVMDPTYGYHDEHDPTSDTFTLAGLTMNGSLAMGSNRITGVPDTPTAGSDAVNQNYVDSVASGLKWRAPAEVFGLVGNANVAILNGLSPNAGDAYVVTDSGTLTRGSVSVTVGDLVQDDGGNWVLVVSDAGGYVPAGTRAVLSLQTALIAPYTDAIDDGKIVDFTGASNTGVDTGETTDGSAILINGDGGYYANLGFVYDGTVPSGTWIQFTGAGQINAGVCLSKDGNTLDFNPGDGIKNDSDYAAVDIYPTNPGLELIGATPNQKQLDVKLKANAGLTKDGSGMFIKIDDTPDTLDVDVDGLKVVGLPSLFKINDTAVGATVTAPNLDTLTDTSNADALHTHTIASTDEAKRVEDTHLNNIAISAGQAVRWSSTSNEITTADNGSAAGSRCIGVARTGGASNPGTSEVVKHGIAASVLSGKTVNTPIFLGSSGALVEWASLPVPGRVIRMGYMVNASDLDVQIMDLGRRLV